MLLIVMNSFMILFHGVTTPIWLGHPHCRGFTITLRHTHTHTHSLGFLWTNDQPDAGTPN